MTGSARDLRSVLDAAAIAVLPGAYDGLSVRSIERAGFPAAFVTGAGVSESRLGRPDVGLGALTDAVNAARDMAACVEIPLLADADTGYGNAVNVFYTVQAFEQAGIAGVMIEDQTWPKRCGHLAGKELIGAEEMAGKVAAAVEARKSDAFVIMARTDAAPLVGVDAAVERAKIYAAAGADLLLADALESADDIAHFAASVDKPVCVNMGFALRRRRTTPLLSPRQLEDLGVSVMIAPRMLTAAAAEAMRRALETLKEVVRTGDSVDRADMLMSFEDLHELTGLAQIQSLEQRFLAKEQLALKYTQPAAP
jgi:2-methylisocitrate lyase-like PEP mutase family enzyme